MIIALMYHEGDKWEAMELARLLADIEPHFRGDVVLALVRQAGTIHDELVKRTILHCKRRFHVEDLESPIGATGHPQGCTSLWYGTISLVLAKWNKSTDTTPHETVMTLDAGDGVPLHSNWIDLAGQLITEATSRGKLIAGSPYFLGECPLHVNPNAIFHLDFFERTSVLKDMPLHDGTINTHFDIYHREAMLTHADLTSIVRTDWRGGGQKTSRELLLDRGRHSIWLHGYKDTNLRWLAREHLFCSPPKAPEILRYTMDQLRLQEKVRRDYEESFQ